MKRGEIYPSWRYHPTAPPVLCQNADQDAALGSEWSDADIRQTPEPASEPEPEALVEAAVEAVAPKKRGRKPKA